MATVAFSLAAATGFGFFNIVSSKSNEHVHPSLGAFLSVVPAALIVAVAAVASGQAGSILLAGPMAVFYFAVAGIANYGVAFVLNFHSVQLIGASRSAAITSGRVLLGTAIALLVLKENITLQIAAGVAMVLGGVYLTMREN